MVILLIILFSLSHSFCGLSAEAFTKLTDFYKGFWISIKRASTYEDYYITSNKDKKFYIEDKLGNGITTVSSVDFRICYILVQNSNIDLQLNVDDYLNFIDGQSLEVATGGDLRGQARLEEFNGYTLTLNEVSDYE